VKNTNKGEIHRESLMANWELCQKGEKPFSIAPLS
jgi:hypothetical protein